MNLSWKTKFTSKSLAAVLLSLISLMVLAAYSNTLYSPPVLDDFHSFIDEPIVKIQTWSLESIINLAKTKFSFYRWIPMTTFAWDIWIGGGELPFLHFTNILIHLLCFFLTFIFIIKLSKAEAFIIRKQLSPFYHYETALWVSGIWVLHPVQTNAVTYLVQRMTSLGALFFVLSMVCYLAGRIRSRDKGARDFASLILYVIAVVSTGLALLSKENAAMIPVAVLLTEWWFFQPDLLGRILQFCRRHWISTGCLILAGLFISCKIVVGLIGGFEGRHFTVMQRLLTEARVVVWYISVLLWPDPTRLSLEHHIELSTSLFHPITTIVSIVFLGILCWWTITRRKSYPLATYGLMWFLVNLVIESTIVPLELVFEHRMYLPSIGLFLSVVALGEHFASVWFTKISIRELRAISYCTVAILVSVLTLGTFERNEVWRDPVTLGAHDAAKNPKSPRAHSNYGVALSRVNRCEEAIDEAAVALQLGQRHYEEYGVSVNTILLCYRNMKEHEKVVHEGRKFIDAWPEDADRFALPSVWLNVSVGELELGRLEAAYESIRIAMMINLRMNPQITDFEYVCAKHLDRLFESSRERSTDLPGMSAARVKSLGGTYWVAQQLLGSGYVAAGEKYLRTAASVDETHAMICQRLLEDLQDERVQNYVQQNKWSFEQKYVQRPFSPFRICMAISYLVRQHKLPPFFARLGEASLDYALQLDPDSSDAHLLKGWYHFEKNQVSEALLAAQKALELDPDYAKAWMGLGFFLTRGSKPSEAVPAFSKALELYPGYPQRASIIGIINSLQNEA
jgi:protein O-mannosyl-transferase